MPSLFLKISRIAVAVAIVACLLPFACKESKEVEDANVEPNPPSWNPITGNQFNMIATGSVFRNGTKLNSSSYWVGSYGPGGIDSDCRSVSQVTDAGIYYSTIRGNSNGEAIHFMIWDGKKKVSFIASEPLNFLSDDTKTDFHLHYSE